jgi:hypothetical protein
MKKFLILLLIICSCHYVPFKERMAAWIGHSKGELIHQWGPPAGTTSDGNGGEILTYSTNRTFHNSNYYGGITSQTVSDYRDFYINPNGNIYYVKWGRR